MSEINVSITETTITQQALEVAEQGNTFTVKSDEDYTNAATLLQTINNRKKAVMDWFEEPVEKAFSAWKSLTNKRKGILDRLEASISSIKQGMNDYSAMIRKKAEDAAAALRAKQKEETDRLMAEAAAKEEAGDKLGAELTFAAAEIVNDMKPVSVAPTIPKVSGISERMTWVAEITDDAQVPVYFSNMTLRPVDTKALNELARTSKGTMQIPGVKFVQKSSIAVR